MPVLHGSRNRHLTKRASYSIIVDRPHYIEARTQSRRMCFVVVVAIVLRSTSLKMIDGFSLLVAAGHQRRDLGRALQLYALRLLPARAGECMTRITNSTSGIFFDSSQIVSAMGPTYEAGRRGSDPSDRWFRDVTILSFDSWCWTLWYLATTNACTLMPEVSRPS